MDAASSLAAEVAERYAPHIRGRVFMVTGCTSGMGRETAFVLAKHGGIGPVRRIGAVFESAGLQLSVALYYDLIAAAACHLAVALPAVRWPSPETDMQDTILATPLRSDGLLLPVPEGPGLGVELDPAKVERYTVPGSVVSA